MPRSSTWTEDRRRPAASAVEPWLVRLVFLLDQAVRVPGTRWRVGLDPILGLLPGAGDALGALLSAGVVLVAARQAFRGSSWPAWCSTSASMPCSAPSR